MFSGGNIFQFLPLGYFQKYNYSKLNNFIPFSFNDEILTVKIFPNLQKPWTLTIFLKLSDCFFFFLKVKNRSWAAHKFILLSRSDLFYKLIADVKRKSSDDKTTLEIPDVNPEIFHQMLTYIYTDSCDLLKIGSAFDFKSVLTEKDCNENDFDGDFKGSFRGKSAYEVTQKKKGKEKKNAKTASERDPIRLLQDMGKKFGVKGLAKRLFISLVKSLKMSSTRIKQKVGCINFYPWR